MSPITDTNKTNESDESVVVDYANSSMINNNITIGTTSSIARVGASNLSGRIALSIQHRGSGKLFYGASGVTTSNGTEIVKGETIVLPVSQDINVYLISTLADQDVRVIEYA